MKRLSIVLIFVFAVGMLLSSCNKKACPAYRTNIETEQTDDQA